MTPLRSSEDAGGAVCAECLWDANVHEWNRTPPRVSGRAQTSELATIGLKFGERHLYVWRVFHSRSPKVLEGPFRLSISIHGTLFGN